MSERTPRVPAAGGPPSSHRRGAPAAIPGGCAGEPRSGSARSPERGAKTPRGPGSPTPRDRGASSPSLPALTPPGPAGEGAGGARRDADRRQRPAGLAATETSPAAVLGRRHDVGAAAGDPSLSRAPAGERASDPAGGDERAPAGSSDEDRAAQRKRWGKLIAAQNAAKRNGAGRYTRKADRTAGSQFGPGMARREPPRGDAS